MTPRNIHVKWGVSSRWSSLYCPMWNSDLINIGRTHPTSKVFIQLNPNWRSNDRKWTQIRCSDLYRSRCWYKIAQNQIQIVFESRKSSCQISKKSHSTRISFQTNEPKSKMNWLRNSNWVFDEHVSVISKINDRKMIVFIGEEVQNSLPVLLTPQNINKEHGTMFVFSLTTLPSFQKNNICLEQNFKTEKSWCNITSVRPSSLHEPTDSVHLTLLQYFRNHLPASQKLQNIISQKIFLVYAFSFLRE